MNKAKVSILGVAPSTVAKVGCVVASLSVWGFLVLMFALRKAFVERMHM